MGRYILRRLLVALPSLVIVTVLIAGLLRLQPGDVVMARLAESGYLSAEDIDAMRADLGLDHALSRPKQHPDNVWSLHGTVECLKQLERPLEAAMMAQRLARALARADPTITASCFCRRQVSGRSIEDLV